MKPFHVHLLGPSGGPIPTSFEEAEGRLAGLDKLAFEADGSFVWARDGGQQQVFGMIYDARDTIQYCELRGHCELNTWRSVWQALVGDTLGVGMLQILVLPQGELQNLQSFEATNWPVEN